MSETQLKGIAEELVAGLEPVRPLAHPLIRVLPWLGAAIVYVVALTGYFGLRSDLAVILQSTAFLFETGLAISLAVSAALAASWLAVPDMRGKGWVVVPPLTLFAVFVFWNVMRAYAEGFHIPHEAWNFCSSHALAFGALPVAGLILLSRQGATVKPHLTGFMSILAVGAMGWLALRYVCASEDAGHIFMYHFAPYIIAGGSLGALARRLYRW